MPSIKGTIKNGLVHPSEAIAEQEGKSVIITIIEPNPNIPHQPMKHHGIAKIGINLINLSKNVP